MFAGGNLDAMLAPGKRSFEGMDEINCLGVSRDREVAINHETFEVRFIESNSIRFQVGISVCEDKNWSMIGADPSNCTFKKFKSFSYFSYSHVE